MVDVVSAKAVSVSDVRVAPVMRTPAAVVVQAPAEQAAAPSAQSTAKAMAATPPVDTDRVAQIKAAIASGTYPILPETVADRLIALSLEWNPDDKA
jgi:negative regulator of flagellin synthesis FlgM